MLLAVADQIRIPFFAVPFTMQTFIVLVVGLSYGPDSAVLGSDVSDHRSETGTAHQRRPVG